MQALSGHSTMKFIFLEATVTAQEPVAAQEQDERLQRRKRLLRQGNPYRARERKLVFHQHGLVF